jgi:hypothetical protein
MSLLASEIIYSLFYVELELFLRPTDSRPVRLGIGHPFGTLDQILSCSFSFRLTITWFFFLRRPLWRENGSVVYSGITPLVPITILYCLIWDCVSFLSPLTTRRDYGGGILTRLHTGLTYSTTYYYYLLPTCTIFSPDKLRNTKQRPSFQLQTWFVSLITQHSNVSI